MKEERKKVLEMLSEGKISADEAERLLQALESKTAEASPQTALTETLNNLPKYLFVKVDSVDGDKVPIRVPLKLIKAGIKLQALLPPDAQVKVNAKLNEKGKSLYLMALSLTPLAFTVSQTSKYWAKWACGFC